MEYNGDDLLKLFDELNIQLLNLNPNVIKAWFDTDDPSMKKFLNWMCSTLSKQNYLSHMEYAEFLELESPLLGEKYQVAVEKLEKKYPGILNVEVNKAEIELLEDELELLIEEERELDNKIAQQEAVQIELSKELALVTEEEIKVAAEYKEAFEECEELSNKMDDVNKQLHSALKTCGSRINDQVYNFEIGPVHQYISNIDVKNLKSNDTYQTSAESILDMTTAKTEFFENKLSIMRNRILHSHQHYLANKVEIEKLTEVLEYLRTFNVDDLFYMKESIFVEADLEAKEETKKRLCALLDTISSRQADFYIYQTKLKYSQQDLEKTRLDLKNITEVANLNRKILSYYVILGLLHVEEDQRINKRETMFRNILEYITDVQQCIDRTGKMNKVIAEFEISNTKPQYENYELVKSMVDIISENNDDFSLSNALETITKFKDELKSVEKQLFWNDFNDHRKMCKEIVADINTLKSFLMCGPTHKVVILPTPLQTAIRQVEKHLKKEEESVKAIISTSTSMNKLMSKWETYRRQLWMYFITDPPKMFLLIQQIQDEVSKQLQK